MEEEQMEPIHPLAPVPDYLTPEVDRTVAASVPPEIAEPRLISELAPALHAPEEHPMVEGQPREPKTATHLDSFSLGEAVEGQAFVSPPETAAGLAPEAEVTQPRATAAGAPSVIDPEWVHVVVQRVVAKMAPSVLSPQLVEDLVRILTEEITADLAGPSPNREKV
jgi:hypothetical protein